MHQTPSLVQLVQINFFFYMRSDRKKKIHIFYLHEFNITKKNEGPAPWSKSYSLKLYETGETFFCEFTEHLSGV